MIEVLGVFGLSRMANKGKMEGVDERCDYSVSVEWYKCVEWIWGL